LRYNVGKENNWTPTKYFYQNNSN